MVSSICPKRGIEKHLQPVQVLEAPTKVAWTVATITGNNVSGGAYAGWGSTAQMNSSNLSRVCSWYLHPPLPPLGGSPQDL